MGRSPTSPSPYATARARLEDLLVRAREASTYLPRLRTDRALWRAWLADARSAHLVVGVAVLAGVLLLPSVRDALVGLVFPDRTTSGFLGLGRRLRQDPRAATARAFIDALYWSLALAGSALTLLLRLPATCAERSKPALRDGAPRVGATDATIAGAAPASLAGAARDATAGEPAGERTVESAAHSAARYVREAELGAGGMGVVHRARDRVLGRDVALKRLYPELAANRELAARFLREAQVLARLSHPHIVSVFDAGEDDEGMWMAMELLPDGSLDGMLQETGLPLPRVVALGTQMADAMAYAHGQGVVHRDFKPDNVLMQGPGHAKITDFGLARLMAEGSDTKLTQPGAVMGSPAYMSPEQATGAGADARSDIYSLGATLFEMVSGRPPFDGESASAVMIKHLTEVPRLPERLQATLPPEFVALLAKMLEKKVEDRPQSMTEVAAALRSLSGA